jgi:hypothetical protein
LGDNPLDNSPTPSSISENIAKMQEGNQFSKNVNNFKLITASAMYPVLFLKTSVAARIPDLDSGFQC